MTRQRVCDAFSFFFLPAGAPAEIVYPGTPGAATMELQTWLTAYDSEV
jgi:hypothetical protein